MTITLDLPKEVERELAAEAARKGLSLPEYALELLKSHAEEAATPRTGAELVEYWIKKGLVGSRPDIKDSQAHARKLRAEAEKRTFEQD